MQRLTEKSDLLFPDCHLAKALLAKTTAGANATILVGLPKG